jgi:hypothetical protein
MAPIVRLEAERGMEPVHCGMLAAKLRLDEHADVFETDGVLALRDLIELAEINWQFGQAALIVALLNTLPDTDHCLNLRIGSSGDGTPIAF